MGCGWQQAGLGPQQRGPAAGRAAQKSRKVTIPLCSALVRPLQGTLRPLLGLPGQKRHGLAWASSVEAPG